MLNLKKYLTIFMTVAFVLSATPALVFADDAGSSQTSPTGSCSGGNVFKQLACKAGTTLNDLRPLVYVIGGFGIIAFAFTAIFGKVSFGHLTSIGIGLFLVAVMGPFITYFTGSQSVQEYLPFGNYLSENYSSTPSNNAIGNDCVKDASGNCSKELDERANSAPVDNNTTVPTGQNTTPGADGSNNNQAQTGGVEDNTGTPSGADEMKKGIEEGVDSTPKWDEPVKPTWGDTQLPTTL